MEQARIDTLKKKMEKYFRKENFGGRPE